MSLKYQPRHVLRDAHSDSINCLRFSVDGFFLVSGGSDGRIVIMKTHTGTLVAAIERGRVAISAIEWTDNKHEQFVAGDSSGYIITVKSAETRKQILRQNLDSRRECQKSEIFWPLLVGIEWMSSGSDELLLIADMFKGVVVWNASTGALASHYKFILPIGSMSLSPPRSGDSYAAFYNLHFEFDVYKLRGTSASHLYNFKLDSGEEVSGPNVILPSIFSNNGLVLVTGTNSGKVQLWDMTRGTSVHVLDLQGKNVIVQALSSFYDRSIDVFFIATGTAEEGSNTKIVIWSTIETDINHSSDREILQFRDLACFSN
ncbi:WD40 repeat-like protein [Schizopora paradoxa]|uniref:WD40 repeat-like protein n=1 Tax=Schizopora paradoxa TaxID=27342 RepID=A0A0H2RMU1_9AGAM|nr:WD40 repeat-like protein [Schizopora paradoxa]